MSILLLTEVFPPRTGGSGRWFRELYGRLPRDQVLIMAGEAPGQKDYDRGHDLRIIRTPMSLPTWGVLHAGSMRAHGRLLGLLRRRILSESISTIHAGKCLPEGLSALALKRVAGTPYLCFVHGEELTLATTSRELTWLTRWVLAGARLMIANSQHTAELLREAWSVPENRIIVLNPGVDTDYFVPAECSQDRESLGWEGRTVILTVGRLQKRKGHDRLIEALPAIRKAVPKILYAILGDGEERLALEKLARLLDVEAHTQFLGERDDITLLRAYQQCDLFALPNRRVNSDIEGFGMVLVEAQACGKAVIAGNSGGAPKPCGMARPGLSSTAMTPALLPERWSICSPITPG